MNYSIFLINLDRSVERLNNAAGQLDSAGVDFERISAVDGKTLENELINKVFDDKMAQKRYHYDLTLGEMGCYLSHVKCWEKIIEDGLDFAVILEDDLLLEPNFKDVIESVPNIETEWHYLKLSCPFKHRPYTEAKLVKTPKGDNVSLVDYKKPPTGTVAQIVSREGAKRLLKNRPPFFRPVDVDLQWSWELNIKVQGLIPYVANVSGELSEIQKISARRTVKKRPFNKIKETVRFKFKG
ncbi:glycosyltransferase family 25 protein [Idiomarina aminovorans]|uniref:glycosyltransferase family 25 protein n=1 Tax=Idiomarina aminovorans TaxID=2914829 RepID=UPI0020034997|nr:glycosyltransferase family 25 protein [Idiomarina sp. ATCH4]MCK7459107.1 glycosyltransferase family 25 protein [Idiomarina sp. ATCH4]